jgi:hypothetical protein
MSKEDVQRAVSILVVSQELRTASIVSGVLPKKVSDFLPIHDRQTLQAAIGQAHAYYGEHTNEPTVLTDAFALVGKYIEERNKPRHSNPAPSPEHH